MALINGIYVQVIDEKIGRGTDLPSHPCEDGFEIKDHARRKPKSVSLSGKIVNLQDMSAYDIIQEIEKMQDEGTIITYSGRNIEFNLQISEFASEHPNTIAGGAAFNMTLTELKTANPAYIVVSSGNEDIQYEEDDYSNQYWEEPLGDVETRSLAVFVGGPLYYFDDNLEWSVIEAERATVVVTDRYFDTKGFYIYQIAAVDGSEVCGWVTANELIMTANTCVNFDEYGGDQQLAIANDGYVYYFVMPGDTIDDILSAYQGELRTSAEFIMQNNAYAFEEYGDFSTLKAYERILLGERIA